MKILKNKTYQGMVDEINDLLNENNKLNDEKEIYLKDLCEYEDKIHKLNLIVEELKEEKNKLICAKGGYTKEINKLKKQVEELDFKLKESMTDKYLVKKIPSGRRPKGQTMKIKDWSKISNITRKVYGDK